MRTVCFRLHALGTDRLELEIYTVVNEPFSFFNCAKAGPNQQRLAAHLPNMASSAHSATFLLHGLCVMLINCRAQASRQGLLCEFVAVQGSHDASLLRLGTPFAVRTEAARAKRRDLSDDKPFVPCRIVRFPSHSQQHVGRPRCYRKAPATPSTTSVNAQGPTMCSEHTTEAVAIVATTVYTFIENCSKRRRVQ